MVKVVRGVEVREIVWESATSGTFVSLKRAYQLCASVRLEGLSSRDLVTSAASPPSSELGCRIGPLARRKSEAPERPVLDPSCVLTTELPKLCPLTFVLHNDRLAIAEDPAGPEGAAYSR